MFLLRHTLCSKRGYSYEWKTAKLHNWPKMGRQLLAQWTTQYFSLYQDCHHIPAAVCLQHRDQRVSLIIPENWEHYQIQWQLEVTSTHAGTDHDKQATGNHEPANEMNTEDPTQGILVWFQPSTVNLEDLETHVPAHPSEREGDASKVETQKRKHSIYTHFPKDRNCDICLRTKITRALCNTRSWYKI